MTDWGDVFEKLIFAVLGIGATLLVVLLAIFVAVIIMEFTTGTLELSAGGHVNEL